jgi:hypothetical protein
VVAICLAAPGLVALVASDLHHLRMSRIAQCGVWFVMACGGAATHSPVSDSKDTPPVSKPSTPALSKDDVVFETVFLHELAADTPRPDEGVCLATRGATSDGAALLAAIQVRYPTAVLNRECSGGGPTGPVTSNGRAAVRFDIGPINWLDDNTARISGGGGHRGGMVANEREYSVVKDGGGWKVVGEKPGMQI